MTPVLLKNTYGYPALSARIKKYAEAQKAKLIISMYNVDPADEGMKIIIAGLPFLVSTKIPVIGYNMYENGAWYRTNLPPRLKENEITMKLPKFHKHPSHDELYNLFVNNKVGEEMSSRFSTYHSLQDLNERVFTILQKRSVIALDKANAEQTEAPDNI